MGEWVSGGGGSPAPARIPLVTDMAWHDMA